MHQCEIMACFSPRLQNKFDFVRYLTIHSSILYNSCAIVLLYSKKYHNYHRLARNTKRSFEKLSQVGSSSGASFAIFLTRIPLNCFLTSSLCNDSISRNLPATTRKISDNITLSSHKLTHFLLFIDLFGLL